MAQQQQPRWRIIGRRVLWAVLLTGGIVLALAFVYSVYGGYRYGWKWTGLVKDADFHKRTLWDWLGLLIVPAVLALGGYLFTRSENQRTRDIAGRQRTVDQEIANQRAENEALQACLDQMSQLLLDKD